MTIRLRRAQGDLEDVLAVGSLDDDEDYYGVATGQGGVGVGRNAPAPALMRYPRPQPSKESQICHFKPVDMASKLLIWMASTSQLEDLKDYSKRCGGNEDRRAVSRISHVQIKRKRDIGKPRSMTPHGT
uniref:Uncharacterized protein n=1 Tax=Oryza sativa subsp. japonica TaxID=39947 RepID=Q10JZ1_ORYSJ|nr:hypothetical protein LOC_Os03g28969 [Oryza sativa Japonica Group]